MALAKTSVRVKGQSSLERVIFSTRFLITVLFSVCLALAYVSIKVEALRIGYELSVSRKKEEEVLKENLLLQAELMRLKSPERVERMAAELGFKFPTQEDLIHTEESTVIGERK